MPLPRSKVRQGVLRFPKGILRNRNKIEHFFKESYAILLGGRFGQKVRQEHRLTSDITLVSASSSKRLKKVEY